MHTTWTSSVISFAPPRRSGLPCARTECRALPERRAGTRSAPPCPNNAAGQPPLQAAEKPRCMVARAAAYTHKERINMNRILTLSLLIAVGATLGLSQKPPLSPPEQTSVTINGKTLTIEYSA